MTTTVPAPGPAGSVAALHALMPTRLVQLAYRVPDIEAACLHWATTFGVGPFLLRLRQGLARPRRATCRVPG